MKKIYNNGLVMFILGGLLFGSISVLASEKYGANLIVYESENGEETVDEALNELYALKNVGDATAGDIKEGKTVLVNGKIIIGTGEDSKNKYTEGYNKGKLEGAISEGTYSLAVSMILDYNNWGANPQVRWDPLVTFKIKDGVPTVVNFYDTYKSAKISDKTVSADPANIAIKKIE